MDPVFDAHYSIVQDAFARARIWLDTAYAPNGDVDYIYERGRLLVAEPETNFRPLTDILRGAVVIEQTDGVAVVSIDDLQDGYLSVPDAIALVDSHFHTDLPPGGTPRVSPNHLFHVERLCSAVEPEVPSGRTLPWPPPREPAPDERPVRIGLVDSGLIDPLDPVLFWLSGVSGEIDPLGPVLPDGLRLIPPFAGHGTFVAGVARCMAPRSEIFVGNELDTCGAQLESKIVQKIEQLITNFDPPIINVSSGAYTHNDWAPIAFQGFDARHPDLTVVAAAGNDSLDRPVFPAALEYVISVGALGPDQTHTAWFSNYGRWVDVYALGEGIINAFTVGQYRYHEPPKQPARQNFLNPIALWSGTSFSAPMVTGMIASRMGRSGESSKVAAQALLAEAEENSIDGVGPALLVAPPIDV